MCEAVIRETVITVLCPDQVEAVVRSRNLEWLALVTARWRHMCLAHTYSNEPVEPAEGSAAT